ncbi:hypothetical protein M440DRAFT_1215499 [Trichoderma longibrachiatum ATCC 18648]|uniref:Heterokaryon incompatibility domain-containing protein n=1 Tax=Trichoderma longibrachiatum ATCC 18648 TaxID=983965 RepID=A0A2T4C7M7_TRILO|nr:hypothetical protein M440DRAFT_1215499 [Trichoderma longibrachiatum ATCC 18648]
MSWGILTLYGLDPCASMFDIGSSERVPESVISPAGIYTMKRWVFGKGEERAALQPTYRPTRLTCVESRKESGLIRLVEGDDDPKAVPYLALSYCWGRKAPSLVATKGNFALLKASIPHGSFCQSFIRMPFDLRRSWASSTSGSTPSASSKMMWMTGRGSPK